jgi:hypothetical protein
MRKIAIGNAASKFSTELPPRPAIGNVMRPRTRDLTLLLNADGDLMARAGAAVLAHRLLPHPLLHLIEEIYPQEVAKARFSALWSERDTRAPDPQAIGCHFKAALANALKLEKCVGESGAIVILDCARQS